MTAHGHHQMVNTKIRWIIIISAKNGEALYSQQKQDGRLKLKKVGKTTRPFRYDLNQIPYNYTVEVTNRLKGLDLIECLNGQWFMTMYRRQ